MIAASDDETFKKCYLCNRELGEDPNEIYMAINQDAMEAQGILDPSELNDEAVIMILCSRCGFHEGFPSVAELHAASAEMERNELKQ